MNGYNEVGKPNYDFRITTWSSIFRKLHIDELPQLLNVLKGDLNIVGMQRDHQNSPCPADTHVLQARSSMLEKRLKPTLQLEKKRHNRIQKQMLRR